jgi:hypothetical protein
MGWRIVASLVVIALIALWLAVVYYKLAYG